MQTQRPNTPTITQPKPPISRAGLRQISRLAKLRNKCNKSTKLYPEASTDHERNPIDINEKITTILNPAKLISTSEAHKQCNKAIRTIVRQASNTLNENLSDKENESHDKSSKYYHNNLKISAGLLPRARDQFRVTTPARLRQEAKRGARWLLQPIGEEIVRCSGHHRCSRKHLSV